jgi:hypothetical protein
MSHVNILLDYGGHFHLEFFVKNVIRLSGQIESAPGKWNDKVVGHLAEEMLLICYSK